MLQFGSIVTFLPMLTEEERLCSREWFVLIVQPSPMEVKWPTLTGCMSPLIVAPYQTVAYLERKTLPTKVAFGATQAAFV